MTTPTTNAKAYHRGIPYGDGSADHRRVFSRNSDSTSTNTRPIGESTTPIWTGYIQDATAPSRLAKPYFCATRSASLKT